MLALVTVGGNRFGADGGGLVVLLVGYAVLALRLRGLRLTPARIAGARGRAPSRSRSCSSAVDAATGGDSHVTSALGDGPGALAGDLADRLELSVRRTAASAGAVAVVLVGLGVLVAVALRRPRSPVTDALLAAIAVSLVLNDTPSDIVGVGAVAAVAVARAGPAAYARADRPTPGDGD